MNHACALMRWYLDEAARFGRAAEDTEETRDAELLEEWLLDQLRKGRREKTEWNMTVNTIRKLGPNALRRHKRVDGALELLADLGRIRIIRPSGTKSQYVLIAPQVIVEYS